MTPLLEQAYSRIAQLSEGEQDSIATLILDEIEDEAQWSQKFAASQDLLSRMAAQALAEYREGKTIPLDSETL